MPNQNQPNYLRIFQGFPYLVTRVVSVLYHIILLPIDFNFKSLLDIACIQAEANQLKTCLVLGNKCSIYLDGNRNGTVTDRPPSSSHCVIRKLFPPYDFPQTEELKKRKAELKAFIKACRGGGYIMGDITKGGRDATPEELERLAGEQKKGVPKGLFYCPTCNGWYGECLDPNPIFEGKVMKVYCRCQNNNLCARCKQPLSDYKLNANYLGEDGQIWHEPGFCGLSHLCPDRRKK